MTSPNDQNERQMPGTFITRKYDFHGIFRLSVASRSRDVIGYFQEEYGAFEDTSNRPVDLEVIFGGFTVAHGDDACSFGKYAMTGEWVYGASRYKVATWQFALNGLEAPTTRLFFKGGLFGPYFLQHFFIEQIMRYRICQKGYLLVHGGCVAEKGSSVLFPGLGHAGKTALALHQALGGRGYQADDYTFVSASGCTYSYPRRLHISDHTNGSCPGITRNMSLRHRLSIKAKRLIYYLTLKNGDLDEAMRIHELVPGAVIEDQAQLRSVMLLTGTNANELKGPVPVEDGELIRRISAINLLEGKPFNDILLACHYNGTASSPAELWGRERDILRRALIGVRGYEVTVPVDKPNPAAIVEGTAHILNSLMERTSYAIPV